MSRLHQISGCDNAERKADVVFLHGLGGNAFATWRHGKDDSTSWPHWLGREFPDVGVWSLGYPASPTRWTRFLGRRGSGHGMALPDRALQVLDLMVQRDLGRRPLLFICHSLGGLLAKQILRTSSDAVEEPAKAVFAKTRAVLFLATPHAGAELVTLVDAFRALFGATVTIQDLRAHDAYLRDLLNWYRNHADSVGIRTLTYYEQRNVKGVTIVTPTSAHPGVGADPVGLDEDHLSIAKPRKPDSQVCGAARDLLRTLRVSGRTQDHESKLLVYLSSGGTCRDPMAKAITLKLLEERSPDALAKIRVEGMALGPTCKAHVSFAAQLAIEDLFGENLLRDYVPETVTSEALDEADLVLVMDHGLLNRKILPPGKSYVFKEFFGVGGDVVDPWPDGRDPKTLSRYRDCASELKAILEAHFEHLLSALGVSTSPSPS